MHGHAACVAQRQMRPLGGQTLFIESVTGLMQDAHQGRQELARNIACRHAHIAGHAAAERMVRDIEPAVVEIEAKSLHHRMPQDLLPLH